MCIRDRSARRAASRAMVLGATVEAIPTISPRRPAPAMPSRPSRTASASLSKPTTMIIAAVRHRAGIGRYGDTGLLRLRARVRVDIVSGHVELGPREMTGHRMSHLAKPDDPDAMNGACAHIPTFLVSTGLPHCRREPNFGDNKPPRADCVPTRRERGASPQHAVSARQDIAGAHARCVSCCGGTPDRTDPSIAAVKIEPS